MVALDSGGASGRGRLGPSCIAVLLQQRMEWAGQGPGVDKHTTYPGVAVLCDSHSDGYTRAAVVELRFKAAHWRTVQQLSYSVARDPSN